MSIALHETAFLGVNIDIEPLPSFALKQRQTSIAALLRTLFCFLIDDPSFRPPLCSSTGGTCSENNRKLQSGNLKLGPVYSSNPASDSVFFAPYKFCNVGSATDKRRGWEEGEKLQKTRRRKRLLPQKQFYKK